MLRRSRGLVAAVVACAGALALHLAAACGGEATDGARSTQSGGHGGAGGSGGGVGGSGDGVGGSGASGGVAGTTACATTMIDSKLSPPCKSDADCADGGRNRCAELVPGGYRTCVAASAAISTTCVNFATPWAECACDGSTCGTGRECYVVSYLPCGGVGGGSSNTCLSACSGDGDCAASEACMAGGLDRPIAQCVSATCRVDADCGGCSRCAPSWDSGCLPQGFPKFVGLRCSCRTDAACRGGTKCMGSGPRVLTDPGAGPTYCE